MKSLKHILSAVALAILALLAGCGSIYDNYPVEDDFDGMPQLATLVLRVGLAAPTRSAIDNSREEMKSLRVVLLDNAGNVEYNRHIDSRTYASLAGTAAFDYATTVELIRTTPGEKKIFFIANEESVTEVYGAGTGDGGTLTDLLDSFATGAGGFDEAINGVWFAPDYNDGTDKSIVLSSQYEFTIGEGEALVEKECWLVHAATKFEFSFVNDRAGEVRIDALSVSALADRMYLLAQVGDDDMYKSLPDAAEKVYWIDWLKAVCDDTTANPDLPENETVNAKYGWIADYDLPAGAAHATKVIVPEGGADASKPVIPTTATGENPYTGVPAAYFAESRYGIADGIQNYTIDITLTDTALENDGESEPEKVTYTATLDLDKLKALFRNTHVKVDISVSEEKVEVKIKLKVGICQWDTDEIDIPTFD